MNRLGTTLVLGALAVCARAALGAEFMWNFANGNLSPASQVGGAAILDYFNGSQGVTSFGNTASDPNVPDTPGGPTSFLHALPFGDGGRGGYGLDYVGVTPNGGGAYVNNFTIGYDALLPLLNWTALFNTNLNHDNDADFYVAPDGAVGIAALGYSPPGVITPNQWHRIVFTHDRTNNRSAFYVDGVEVFSGTAGALDDRYSLYTDDNAGLDMLIFGEGDASGNYTNDMYVASVYFADRALSREEAIGLGGVTPGGIVVPEPGVAACLAWAGAVGLWRGRAMRRRRG